MPDVTNPAAAGHLSRNDLPEFVLGAKVGSICALGGVDSSSLRILLDQVEPTQDGRRALFFSIAPQPTAELIVDQAIELLAETALQLWPNWFSDPNFTACRNDTLGHLAAGIIARDSARRTAG
ncbi:MAG: hypothetical protein WAV78_43295, partial [Xanthobacteraceae bacterium]